MDKQKIVEMRKDITKALEEVCIKHNVEIKQGNATFDADSFNVKISFIENSIDGKSIEQRDFEKYCTLFGLTKEDYKKKVVVNDKSFELVGLNINARKNTHKIRDAKGTYTISRTTYDRSVSK